MVGYTITNNDRKKIMVSHNNYEFTFLPVLPKFEVTIKAPETVSVADEKVTINVCGK